MQKCVHVKEKDLILSDSITFFSGLAIAFAYLLHRKPFLQANFCGSKYREKKLFEMFFPC